MLLVGPMLEKSCDALPLPGCHKRCQGKAALGLLLGLAVSIVVVAFYLLAEPSVLELKLYDLRQRCFPAAEVAENVTLVLIDDASLEQIGRWPWPRRYLADYIQVAHDVGAEWVVLDILFPEEQPIELAQVGVTDVSSYEYHPPIAGRAEARPIDNDGQLSVVCKETGQVVLPFHGRLTDDDTHEQFTETRRRVMTLLDEERGLSFEQVYHAVYPHGDILRRDMAYQTLLHDYCYVRGLIALQQFDFSVAGDSSFSLPRLGELHPPVPLLAESMVGSGFVTAREDADGAVRRVWLLAEHGKETYGHLMLAAADKMLGRGEGGITVGDNHLMWSTEAGERRVTLDREGGLLVRWPGVAFDDTRHLPITRFAEIAQLRHAIENNEQMLALLQLREQLQFQLSTVPDDISELDQGTREQITDMRNQLDSLQVISQTPEQLGELIASLEQQYEAKRDVLAEQIGGHTLLIGSVATGAPDFFVTSVSDVTPGIMLHYTALNTLLQEDYIYQPPRWMEVLLILLAGLVITVITAYCRPFISGSSTVVLAIVLILVNFFVLYGRLHCWVVLVSPLLALAGVFTVVTFYRQITEGYYRRFITTRFKQYVSPQVVDKIVASGGNFSFTGESREITCYFSDLAGFTTISERLGPEQTVSLLNRYLDRMTETLDRFDATINKFEGDGIFSFFGAPVALPRQADLACQAALAAQEELDQLNQALRRDNPATPLLTMRIGLCTGPVVVGDCGSQRRFDYTAIGDTVNLAARLESANKYFGTAIMIAGSTYDKLTDKSRYAVRYLGWVKVVGKHQHVDIYELKSIDDSLADDAFFTEAVKTYQQGSLEQARELFEQYQRNHPDDKAVSLYLAQCGHCAAHPEESFDGAVTLTGK